MKGTLGDIGFIELLNLVSKRNGRLSITSSAIALNSRQYDWYMYGQVIFAAHINQKSVTRQEAFLEMALRLANDEESDYSFVSREAIDKFPIEVCFNLKPIIAEVLAKLTPTDPCRKHFPNLGTKFEASADNRSQLTSETLTFWNRTEAFFAAGTSAQAVASALNLRLEDVRLEFYRLRMLEMITPVRRFAKAPSAVVSESQPAPAEATPAAVAHHLASLPQTPLKFSPRLPPSRPQPTAGTEKKEERKTLIRRMLGAFFKT